MFCKEIKNDKHSWKHSPCSLHMYYFCSQRESRWRWFNSSNLIILPLDEMITRWSKIRIRNTETAWSVAQLCKILLNESGLVRLQIKIMSLAPFLSLSLYLKTNTVYVRLKSDIYTRTRKQLSLLKPIFKKIIFRHEQ